MSLLNSESREEADDAALGESFTKGSGHLIWAALAAAVVVSAAIAILFITGHKPPIVTGEIVQVWAHPCHVETSGFDANGDAMEKQSFDQVLLFAHIRLKNQGQGPLHIEDIVANARQADGIDSISAGGSAQFEEVFVAYPELAALHTNGLSPHATIPAGQSIDGTVFWAIRHMSKQQWDARTDLNFTIKLQNQPSLVLAPHTAVIVQ
jgi:hypothetical protein